MYSRYRARRWVFVPFAIIVLILFGWVVQLLWNNVAVPVLHVGLVTYWQGLGILLLSKILFSSFNGRGGYRRDGHWKQRMMWESMTPEQKEKFREEWRNRCRNWKTTNWNTEAGSVTPEEA